MDNSSEQPADHHHGELDGSVGEAWLTDATRSSSKNAHLSGRENPGNQVEYPSTVQAGVGDPHVEEPLGQVTIKLYSCHEHHPEDHLWYGNEHVEKENHEVVDGGQVQSGVAHRTPKPGERYYLDNAVTVNAHGGILSVGLDIDEPAPEEPPDSVKDRTDSNEKDVEVFFCLLFV